ncbi:precorrin-2 C(20)-methyltransferase [Rubrobacter indicoceani]|uniref:precorrin-2 C(20)-methyltransferase n=1 Tax=Rubrobacter indicoceani TaxID=2051957 RepID=UPI0013C48AD8|nr:precorrin-2 C(20)-methyltransferase [Rubrobacter indicoceani]
MRLVGVGVGPGDPELLTLKGLRALREADVVFVPVGDAGEVGRAEAVVAAHLGGDGAHKIRRLVFALSADAGEMERNHRSAARTVAAELGSGLACAFATIGDPNVYSTFTYLARRVRDILPGVGVSTVPGITAMQDLASRSGTVLVEGDERLTLVPFVGGGRTGRFSEALATGETVVCYKGGARLAEVVGVASEAGRLENAVYGARLGGGEAESVGYVGELEAERLPYLSTVIFNDRGREFDGE